MERSYKKSSLMLQIKDYYEAQYIKCNHLSYVQVLCMYHCNYMHKNAVRIFQNTYLILLWTFEEIEKGDQNILGKSGSKYIFLNSKLVSALPHYAVYHIQTWDLVLCFALQGKTK